MFLISRPDCYHFAPTEGSQEHSNLSAALVQIRNIITAVDLHVSKYEKCQELQEVLARLENKSLAKLKNGKVFRKQDLHTKHRDLQHKGLVYWKTATGRLKGVHEIICAFIFFWLSRQAIGIYFYYFTVSTTDTLALLLTDVLVFLQEKDQRFVFTAVVSLDCFQIKGTMPSCLSNFPHPLTIL